jgi:hypothetical protein
MLAIEPDFVPHYFSILIDKFKVLIAGHEYYKIPICDFCGSTDVVEFEGKYYCLGNYIPQYEMKRTGLQCVSVEVMNDTEKHEVKEEYVLSYINKVIMKVLRRLQEPDGYLMNLYVLEGYLFRQDQDDFFETVDGDIRKAAILQELYKLKKVVIGYLAYIRSTIRFSATLKSPPVRVG